MITSDLDAESLQKLEREVAKALAYRKLEFYQPYPKQIEFHHAGGLPGVRERLLIAANQVGKTLAAAAELTVHATGRYPKWWRGKRFDKPIISWASGATGQTTRDNPQRLLMGEIGSWGTGMLPKHDILETKRAIHGVVDSIDTLLIKHKPTGGISRISFKSYDQGRERWQGDTLDALWFDEEPPEEIYSEGKTRTQAVNGIVFMTFTPLLGMSAVVKRFLMEKPVGTHITVMTIHDALHYTEEQRKLIIAGYPEHEREARSEGIPTMGSGRVFPVTKELVEEDPISIPDHWPRLAAIDIGWTHPTATVWVAHDRDTDTVHVYDCHRVKEQTPIFHAAAIKARGEWIPCVWPHDAIQADKGSGVAIAQQYRELGVNMTKHKATLPSPQGKPEGSGGTSLEAGLLMMLDRMQTGRLKVSKNLGDWWEEFRLYHRKNGLVVKEGDDLMSATRYAVMSLRHARVRRNPDEMRVMDVFRPSDRSMGVLG